MAPDLRLGLKLQQKAVLTPQLRQALKVLALARLELRTEIAQELLVNPCLEEDESTDPNEEGREEPVANDDGLHADDPGATGDVEAREEIDWDNYFSDDEPRSYASGGSGGEEERPDYEAYATRPESLFEHLAWQLHMNESDPECVAIGEFLIGNLLENGHLSAPPAELAQAGGFELAELEIVRARLQEYDPPGCFALDLRDSLLAQLRAAGEEDGVAARLLHECPEALAGGGDDAALSAKLGVPVAEVALARARLRRLDPEPGLRVGGEGLAPPEPDLVLTLEGEEGFTLSYVDEGMPRLRVSGQWRKMLRRGSDLGSEEKGYLRERMRAAVWFLKSLEERRRTVMKVATEVFRRQLPFFTGGELALRPLLLREVAEPAGVHESTVSRVAAGKYVLTPKGLLPLKFFFVKKASSDGGADLSALQVKAQIREIIAREGAGKRPLSDDKIAGRLRDDYNVTLARRTVQKYREEMGIPPAHRRRAALSMTESATATQGETP